MKKGFLSLLLFSGTLHLVWHTFPFLPCFSFFFFLINIILIIVMPQSMGSQKVGHDWATNHTHTHCYHKNLKACLKPHPDTKEELVSLPPSLPSIFPVLTAKALPLSFLLSFSHRVHIFSPLSSLCVGLKFLSVNLFFIIKRITKV